MYKIWQGFEDYRKKGMTVVDEMPKNKEGNRKGSKSMKERKMKVNVLEMAVEKFHFMNHLVFITLNNQLS